jgi:endonuclease IV
MATNYLTKWAKVRPLKTSGKQELARFVYERIVTHFGILLKMISNNGLQFISEVIEKLMKKLSIKHIITTIYKPNTNGLVEHTNKVMYNILSKEVEVCKNLHNWDKQVHHAMWVYNSTFKSSSGFTSFRLAYGVN